MVGEEKTKGTEIVQIEMMLFTFNKASDVMSGVLFKYLISVSL